MNPYYNLLKDAFEEQLVNLSTNESIAETQYWAETNDAIRIAYELRKFAKYLDKETWLYQSELPPSPAMEYQVPLSVTPKHREDFSEILTSHGFQVVDLAGGYITIRNYYEPITHLL